MVEWLDLQPFLARLRADLQPGQLVHGEHFNLFDAMCALEIGNPKTDAAAAVRSQQHVPAEPAEEQAAAGPASLTYEQVLRVVDHMMAQEVGWQRGHTLPQTVFTCLYLLHPERCVPAGICAR